MALENKDKISLWGRVVLSTALEDKDNVSLWSIDTVTVCDKTQDP